MLLRFHGWYEQIKKPIHLSAYRFGVVVIQFSLPLSDVPVECVAAVAFGGSSSCAISTAMVSANKPAGVIVKNVDSERRKNTAAVKHFTNNGGDFSTQCAGYIDN